MKSQRKISGINVMVFGTFDFLHSGHLSLFKQARKHGDELIVVVGRDTTVREVKGKLPIHSESERLDIIAHINLVDKAVLGSVKDKYKIIGKYKPDVIALGYDQTEFIDGLENYLQKSNLKTKIIRLKSYKPLERKSAIYKKML